MVVWALKRHIERYSPVEIEIDDETDLRNPRRRLAKLLFLSSTVNPIHRADWAHI
ncbi:hypothetical protein Pth03_18810 [Planotetraspora thailandica]|uniref:Uncharacterized protein n=1 Tax=Planotetraspora thailandica TaxID=487172 RepID=A0A8J3UXR7_9ACTN|nr:hypothetical protein Pth03_18810 [Planotetraspora thailandica]